MPAVLWAVGVAVLLAVLYAVGGFSRPLVYYVGPVLALAVVIGFFIARR